MDRVQYAKVLQNYIPEKAVEKLIDLLEENPTILKITKQRKTKHGDFRVLPNKQTQVSVNHNLNPYHFLLTLIHELAHLKVYRQYGKVQPHGKEWKQTFKYMMLPFINNTIFPNDLLPYLAQYFINPKAATGSDVQLSLALKKYDPINGKVILDSLEEGSQFKFRGQDFVKGKKARTRITCMDIKSKKEYLIHQNTEVEVSE